jgi:MFS superfamily sulfate permease-like transporter
MVVVLAGLFASLSGDVGLILTAVMLAGLFQVFFGLIGAGNYIRLVPYPVVSGFMSGIGVIIIILQIRCLFRSRIALGHALAFGLCAYGPGRHQFQCPCRGRHHPGGGIRLAHGLG